MKIILIVICTSFLFGSSAAQIIMQKAVISNAGGSTANATTKLDYTVGETAVGVASNGTLRGQFGFWHTPSLAASVQRITHGPIKEVLVHPNPAVSTVNVTVELTAPGSLNLILYDAAGHEVATMFSGKKPSGLHSFRFDAEQLITGTYFIAALMPGALMQTRLTIVR